MVIPTPPTRGLFSCFLVLNSSYPRLNFPPPLSSFSFFLSLFPILSAPPSAVLPPAPFFIYYYSPKVLRFEVWIDAARCEMRPPVPHLRSPSPAPGFAAGRRKSDRNSGFARSPGPGNLPGTSSAQIRLVAPSYVYALGLEDFIWPLDLLSRPTAVKRC